jgi:uncharacterized protein (DUF433 family)/DNA-binding transcriptional MerR regulator
MLQAMSDEVLAMNEDEQFLILEAFRGHRGRYRADRAAQLSGIPQRTIYHWAKEGLLVPDFHGDRPKTWSYRDLVYLRLFAWLRTKRMPPTRTAEHVRHVRSRLETDTVTHMIVRSEGAVVLLGDETVDALSGQQLLSGVLGYLSTFDLMIPVGIDDLTDDHNGRLWGPNLVRPSRATRISPWVMAGEPCITATRVPTSTLFALHRRRGLSATTISSLYPGVTSDQVFDALELEAKLRGEALAA